MEVEDREMLKLSRRHALETDMERIKLRDNANEIIENNQSSDGRPAMAKELLRSSDEELGVLEGDDEQKDLRSSDLMKRGRSMVAS